MFEVELESGRRVAFRFETYKLANGPASHVTNCYARLGNKFKYFGSAFCSKLDIFSHAQGKYISLQRACDALQFTIKARRKILDGFSKYEKRNRERKIIQIDNMLKGLARKHKKAIVKREARRPRFVFVLYVPVKGGE